MCTLDVQNYKVRYIYNVMYLLCCYRCCTTVSGLAVVENNFFFSGMEFTVKEEKLSLIYNHGSNVIS